MNRDTGFWRVGVGLLASLMLFIGSTQAQGPLQPPAPSSPAVPAPAPASDALTAQLKELEANPELLAASVARGRKLAAFCANCHGANGNSSLPDVPNLAGQNSAYLLTQMKKFAGGQRKDPFMVGMIKAMSDKEKLDAVLFYATQSVAPQPADDATAVARGKAMFNRNCFRCHGAEGLGSDLFPRLAGQKKTYVSKTLHRYRDGTGERLDPLMAANTKFLTDEDIAGLAAFVAAMR